MPETQVKIKYTYKDVVRSLRRAVESYGQDWVDPNTIVEACQYRYELDEVIKYCIVGFVCIDLGITDRFAKFEGESSSALLADHSEVSHKAKATLRLAQTLQDTSVPWGKAVEFTVSWMHDNWTVENDSDPSTFQFPDPQSYRKYAVKRGQKE